MEHEHKFFLNNRNTKIIQTHNATSVSPSFYLQNSNWIDSEGFDKIVICLVNDASTVSSVDINWSFDGISTQGKEFAVVPSNTSNNKIVEISVKGKYFKLTAVNGDTVAHIMSVWAYLKA